MKTKKIYWKLKKIMRDKPLLNRNINSITLYVFIISFSLFSCVSLFCLRYKTSKKKLLGYMMYVGKYQKAYIKCYAFYPVIFLTNFPKFVLIKNERLLIWQKPHLNLKKIPHLNPKNIFQKIYCLKRV